MTTLTHETLLRLHGPDAARFLQGQTTADFESADPHATLRGAFCDPKGRVLADFLGAVRAPDDILLRLRTSVAMPLLDHLGKYLMFSKATLEKLDWSVGATPEDSAGRELCVDGEVLRIPRGIGLTELWAPSAKNPGTLDAHQSQSAEIALGEARVEQATIGRYLPQDLNYDLNGAVSFTKGCYTGQEIIARLHYRGKPKRRLYPAFCSGNQQPAPGSALLSEGDRKVIGSVVNSASTGEGCHLLVETIDGALEAGLLTESGEIKLLAP